MPQFTEAILESVRTERERQDRKWGEQNHDPAFYYVILMEEVGEVAEAIFHMTTGMPLKKKDGTVLTTKQELEKHYLEELTHTQAVAVAMTEAKLRAKVREVQETFRGVTHETVEDR